MAENTEQAGAVPASVAASTQAGSMQPISREPYKAGALKIPSPCCPWSPGRQTATILGLFCLQWLFPGSFLASKYFFWSLPVPCGHQFTWTREVKDREQN